MIKTLVLLIIVGANRADDLEKFKTALNKLFEPHMETCDDARHVFEVRNSMEKLKKNYLKSDGFENHKQEEEENEYTEEENLENKEKEELEKQDKPKGNIFGNSTEWRLNTLFENIFGKLRSLINFNLNKVSADLTKENYATEQNKSNLCCVRNNPNITYLDYMDENELRRYGKFLICFFVTLANSSNNNSFVVQELLNPIEKMIQNSNSSKSMLILINSFLSTAIEGACAPAYKTLYFNYAINQLKTIQDFDKSELTDVQNISDLQLGDYLEKLKQAKTDGIVTLFLGWRLKLQKTLPTTNVSEYLPVVDETFLQAVEDSNFRTVQFRGSLEPSPLIISKKVHLHRPNTSERQGFKNKITAKIKCLNKKIKNSYVRKTLQEIRHLIKSPLPSTSLLEFVVDFLHEIDHNEMKLFPAIYKYMARELSLLEPFDISTINRYREWRIEEIAVVLKDYLERDPNSIITVALDWLVDLKINFVARRKTTTVFDILESTFQEAKKRQAERRKATPLTTYNAKRSSNIVQNSQILLNKEDREKLHRLLGLY